jgi:hypothetical protein
LPLPLTVSASDPVDVPMDTVAVRDPIAPGVNVTLIVHDAPPASAVLTAHVPLRLKSAALVPPTDSDATDSVAAPAFVNVAICVLVLPTTTVPKFIDVGVSCATAGAIDVAAACDTTYVWPPTVRFAERAAPVFAATMKLTVVLPEPLDDDDSASHDALLDAFHGQPAPVDSAVLPDSPAAGAVTDVEPSAYVQPEAWLTANASPPTVIVALRCGPALAAYEYGSEPVPDALVPIDTHDALLAALHAQSACVVTPIEPDPDDAPTVADDGASAHVHDGVLPVFDARKLATVSAF